MSDQNFSDYEEINKCIPINPKTGTPFFTLPVEGWKKEETEIKKSFWRKLWTYLLPETFAPWRKLRAKRDS